MKLLISGATGFIGKNLTEKLLEKGNTVYAITRPSTKKNILNKKIKVYSFDGDILDLISFMEKEKFDGVIHLASLFTSQHKPDDIKNLVESNLYFSTALLEASVLSDVPWFINTGTFWQHYNNKKYSPVNLYAATKQAFETLAQYYLETSRIHFVTIKLCDTFGPSDPRQKIIALWTRISSSGETLDMSPGGQLINMTYIDDVVNGFIKMVDSISKDHMMKLRGKSFVVSSPKIVTLKKLASIFEKASGKKLHINWGKKEYKPREVMVPFDKGETIPGWKPAVSLEEGIRRTLNQRQ